MLDEFSCAPRDISYSALQRAMSRMIKTKFVKTVSKGRKTNKRRQNNAEQEKQRQYRLHVAFAECIESENRERCGIAIKVGNDE